MRDIVIIGAGVSGSACAWALGKYHADILVIEKEEDVCCGTSKANSAIVHGGFDAKYGTWMAKLNVKGSRMMETLARDLDVPYNRCGSLVVCLSEADLPRLEALMENGVANGVEGLRIIGREELAAMEPNISDRAVAALWAPTGAIICPFLLNIALAENANQNGVEFQFQTAVTGFEKIEGGWRVLTNRGSIETRLVVNAAGVYAGQLHNLVSGEKMEIHPTRGDYLLLDKQTGNFVRHTIFTLPDEKGKGVLVSPTVHGNTIVGPTAIPVEDFESTATTAEGLAQVAVKAANTVKNLPVWQVITSFAGLRAKDAGHEFRIGEVGDAPGFIDCAGIESPGLSACPAIGEMVAEIVREKLRLREKNHYVTTRKGIVHPGELPFAQRAALVREKPAYGQIVCRCEGVTEGEILDAIHRPLGAKSLDGVKRRVRTGMGRCQGGFCTPRVMEILARELGVPLTEITKTGPDSPMLAGGTGTGEDGT
ncbi:MAG: NAD(P)/FAD-dependent oxidoreductase [Faecousia sp.]